MLALAIGVSACGPAPGVADETSSVGSSSVGSSSVGEDTTSSSTSSSADTGEPAPACAEQSEAARLQWLLAGDEVGGHRRAVAAIPDGDFAVAGSVRASATQTDAIVDVRDADGAIRWSDVYAGVEGLDDDALDVAVDHAGFVHVLVLEFITSVLAERQATVDARLVVLRYASDGSHVWRWELEHSPVEPFGQYVPDGSIAVVEDEVVLLAMAWGEPTKLLSLDRFGNLVSEVEVALAGDLDVQSRDIASDGAVVFGGNIERAGTHAAWIGRFNREGAPVWSDSFGTIDDRGLAAIAGAAGETYFAWITPGLGGSLDAEVSLRRYEPDGTAAWTESLLTTGNDAQLAGTVACDGTLLVTASHDVEPLPDARWNNHRQLWVAGYGSDGTRLWLVEHEFPGPYLYGSGHALAGTYDGAAIVLGSYLDESGSDYAPWLARIGR